MDSIYTSVILPLTLFVTSSTCFIVLTPGRCPKVPVKQSFDLDKFLGRWYSFETFNAPFQVGLSCITTEYSRSLRGKVQVLNTGIRDIRIFGRSLWRSPVTTRGEATVVNSSTPAGLNVEFDDQPVSDSSKANYFIVDTDYDTYSIVYSCTQPTLFPLKIEFAWILTRRRSVKPQNINLLKQNLQRFGINTANFKRVDNAHC